MKSLNTLDWAWLAGVFEGEAAFTFCGKYPRISLGMTDEDIIARVADYFEVNYHLKKADKRNPVWKPMYQLHIIKTDVLIECFLELFPFLGSRRREAITRFRDYWISKGMNVPEPHLMW